MQARTHYDVLKVDRDASDAELRASYRARILELHPDKRGGDAAGVGELGRVRAAFTTLSNTINRAAYNATLDVSVPMLIADDVHADEFERDGDDLLLPCRCGGFFAVPAAELAIVDVVPCDTCSLGVRIEH